MRLYCDVFTNGLPDDGRGSDGSRESLAGIREGSTGTRQSLLFSNHQSKYVNGKHHDDDCRI
jgi:hypothetical protein